MVTLTIIRLLIACLSLYFDHSGRSLAGSQLSADGRDYFRMNSHYRTAFGDAAEHYQVRQWITNEMLVSVPLWVGHKATRSILTNCFHLEIPKPT
jgi:hypothetical protein